MKNLRYTVVLLAMMIAAGCYESTSSSKTTGAFGESKKVSDACFDRKMDQWYKSFNEYQSAGYDMETADSKAVADAMMACESCMAEEAQVEE